ncbi:MAG TPA: cytochrome C biogenesis protein [Cytophagales bacterium]|jgi:cytochrome c-type biogenesis protein CcmE|nr:cytochrome C biogenesis protein [Cytophagales bacterium]
MKTTHIILLVVIAAAIGVIISLTGSTSSYVTFKEAKEMAANGENDKIHVVGKLRKDASGNLLGVEYNPQIDPNYFKFDLTDTMQTTMSVVYGNPKPVDFERSEQIVIIGSVKDEVFVADKILMKCPSKYTEKEI